MPTQPRLIPLGATACLAAVYLTLLWRLGDTAHWGMSVIFGMAIASLLWDGRQAAAAGESATKGKEWPPGAIGFTLGIILIAVVLGLSLPLANSETFIRLMPLVAGVGVTLLVAGFRGLGVYWQALALLFFLSVPRLIFSLIQDISPITARLSAILLWYVGYNPQIDGVYITLKQTTIQVWEGCSGAESICYMIGIAAVCLVLYPVKSWMFQLTAVMVAALLGFVINAARVSLLTVLMMKGNTDAFFYWHEGNGSLIFGAGAVILFGVFYWAALQLMREPAPLPNTGASLHQTLIEIKPARFQQSAHLPIEGRENPAGAQHE